MPNSSAPDEGGAWWAWPLEFAGRACCCPARPAVVVVMPPTGGRPYPVDLLLCAHHYRASLPAVLAADAAVYDAAGTVIPAAGHHPRSQQITGRHPGRTARRFR